jgi:dihydroorotase
MVMERMRLIGGRLVDPSQGVDELADVVVGSGRVLEIVRGTERSRRSAVASGERLVDVEGMVIAPGFVDLHCHLREPGYEDKETIASGTRAAAAGGFTTVCALPDTRPTIDTGSDVEALLTQARRDAVVRVLPIGTVTKGREGQELSEMADMETAGAVAFSDDGRPIRSSSLLRHALEYSLLLERPIGDYAEDTDLAAGGVMNEGVLATQLGLKGVPRAAEEIAVSRDLALARLTGGRLHLSHLSTAAAVEQVRRARAAGLRVTAAVTPHHLVLTDEWVAGPASGRPYDTNARTRPPLRGAEDAAALLDGLRDGTIDCVVTDHAPQRWVDKAVEFDQAEPGISGLETTFALLMRLVHAGELGLGELIASLTARPCAAWGLPYGTLRAGAAADVVVLDPDQTWVVDAERLLSKGKNTPLHGQALRGAVLLTIANGRIVYRNGL